MHLDQAVHQMSIDQMELPLTTPGATPRSQRSGEAESAVHERGGSGLDAPRLMERIVERGNLARALKRVRRNKGSPGVDGRTVNDLVVDVR